MCLSELNEEITLVKQIISSVNVALFCLTIKEWIVDENNHHLKLW